MLALDRSLGEQFAMARYPAVDSLEGLPDDSEIYSFHRAKLCDWKLHILLWSLVAVIIGANFFALNSDYEVPEWWLRVLPCAPLLVFLEIIRRYYNQKVYLKSNVIEFHKGRLGLNYAVPVLDYDDIREIRIDQTVVQRILGFGEVSISTAGSDIREMQIEGVPQPHQFKLLVERLRALREHSLAAEHRSKD